MGVSFDNGGFLIDAAVDKEEVRRVLKAHEPWRHLISFSNGVSTLEFDNFEPFDAKPTYTIQIAERKLGPLSGYKRALDMGCNAGHNSFYLAARYGTEVVGVDISERHLKVATELARLADIGHCSFLRGSAETFVDPKGFDLIIHFGTLYHLKNPVMALETALKNLRPGGLMLLETHAYGGRGEMRAKLINGLGGDKSNWWALGERAVVELCAIFGARAERVNKHPMPMRRFFRQSRIIFKVTKQPATSKP